MVKGKTSGGLAAVDIFRYRNIIPVMPRAATTADVFNAIAEGRRRDILVYLAPMERPVGDIVSALGLNQPSVSKHLRCCAKSAWWQCGETPGRRSIAPMRKHCGRCRNGRTRSIATGGTS